ncbi:MAG: desulfoferrodoxin [Geoalkalibacter sp.]|uniref:Desulfoferrodoxin n=1 Tax=Geoalkalibacter subterraneus TaxID=483547 RepID=A0A0B5FGU1_9BACT|nr:desulfoferrodoxin [Geoalkalibacter subterraneus]AJF07392.1 desulfoferrodoxin [Geoalkalibacter subterraneus]MDY6850244.1 desulfoferrodoxin [Thermodesulfobacteriota bacterium]
MPQKLEVYKCEMCGNIVEVLHGGGAELVCCGKEMVLMKEKGAAEEGKEKHVPVIERAEGRITVKVGSVPHPMEEKHYIEWIELIADGKVYRQFLKPGEKPEAVFAVDASQVTAREYCNVHGHWQEKG